MDDNISSEHFIRNNSSLAQNQPAINSYSDSISIVETSENANNINENFNAPSPALNPKNINQSQPYYENSPQNNETNNPNLTPNIPYPHYTNIPSQESPYIENKTPNQDPHNVEEAKPPQNNNSYSKQKRGIRILILVMSLIMIFFVIIEISYLNYLGIYTKCTFIIIDEGVILLCAILYLISLILSLIKSCVINPILMTIIMFLVMVEGPILRSIGNNAINDVNFISTYYMLFLRFMAIRTGIFFFAICPAPLTYVLKQK